jgi:hypothetical protein
MVWSHDTCLLKEFGSFLSWEMRRKFHSQKQVDYEDAERQASTDRLDNAHAGDTASYSSRHF